MAPIRKISTLAAPCALILLASGAMAHMEMSWPHPLRSKFNPDTPQSMIDYSMTSPLNSDGSNFPCKGYQNDKPLRTTVAYDAGSTYNMTLAGSATHGGGSCQLSLSYDNGATFRVIKSMIGGCPLNSTYDFTIPDYAPSGAALFAWTWQNFEGNREYYMNCAEVSIVGSGSSKSKRRAAGSMGSLPYLWKANLAGINNCSTTPSTNPVYPNPGPDVIYGDGMSAYSPASPGDCDEPLPYGQTYRDLGGSGSSYTSTARPEAASGSAASESSHPSITFSAVQAQVTTAAATPAMTAMMEMSHASALNQGTNGGLRVAAASTTDP
ncbi:hypothetical protein LTR28_012481, partial [Elasticomyces elasticus]